MGQRAATNAAFAILRIDFPFRARDTVATRLVSGCRAAVARRASGEEGLLARTLHLDIAGPFAQARPQGVRGPATTADIGGPMASNANVAGKRRAKPAWREATYPAARNVARIMQRVFTDPRGWSFDGMRDTLGITT